MGLLGLLGLSVFLFFGCSVFRFFGFSFFSVCLFFVFSGSGFFRFSVFLFSSVSVIRLFGFSVFFFVFWFFGFSVFPVFWLFGEHTGAIGEHRASKHVCYLLRSQKRKDKQFAGHSLQSTRSYIFIKFRIGIQWKLEASFIDPIE